MSAISKIKTEMNGSNNNPYVQVVGRFLLQHIEANPHDTDKILTEGKTIAKSLDAMKTEARKQQHNGMAMLTDAEGFAIVLKYFGIEGAPSTNLTPAAFVPAAAPQATSDFDVSLDDLLGGL